MILRLARFWTLLLRRSNYSVTFRRWGLARGFVRKKLRDLRFFVMPPPYNRWIVFYRVTDYGVGIVRVLHGSTNWRQELERFF